MWLKPVHLRGASWQAALLDITEPRIPVRCGWPPHSCSHVWGGSTRANLEPASVWTPRARTPSAWASTVGSRTTGRLVSASSHLLTVSGSAPDVSHRPIVVWSRHALRVGAGAQRGLPGAPVWQPRAATSNVEVSTGSCAALGCGSSPPRALDAVAARRAWRSSLACVVREVCGICTERLRTPQGGNMSAWPRLLA